MWCHKQYVATYSRFSLFIVAMHNSYYEYKQGSCTIIKANIHVDTVIAILALQTLNY